MIPKQISKEDVWRCIKEKQQVYYAYPNAGTCSECQYETVTAIQYAIDTPEVIFFVLTKQKESEE